MEKNKTSLEGFLASLSNEAIQNLFKYGKESNEFNGYSFEGIINLDYWFVKHEMKYHIKNSTFTFLIKDFFSQNKIEIDEAEIMNVPHPEAFAFVIWLMRKYEDLLALEKQIFYSEPNMDLIASGVSMLDRFGEHNTLNVLAGNNILEWDKAKKLMYSEAFTFLYIAKTNSMIQENYQKIISNKKTV